MSAHIVNKNLEPDGLPGTLSRRVIQGVLRDSLGYHGVVFSDDMHMHAISRNYGLEESIRLCINAGVDVLCFANNVPPAERVTADQLHRIIRKLVNEGKISMQRINESYARVTTLKKRLSLNDAFSLQNEIDRNLELSKKMYQQAKDESDRLKEERKGQEAHPPKPKKRKAKN
jgi:beta-N-acetylhexosaminidase